MHKIIFIITINNNIRRNFPSYLSTIFYSKFQFIKLTILRLKCYIESFYIKAKIKLEYLKILSWANSLIANNNIRSIILEIKKGRCKIVKIIIFCSLSQEHISILTILHLLLLISNMTLLILLFAIKIGIVLQFLVKNLKWFLLLIQ